MKSSLLPFIFSLSTLVYLGTELTSVRADTIGSKFYCGQSQSVPTTMAQTSRGAVPIIHWVSALGEDYTPEYRCKTVSEKFQMFYDDGRLNYLTTGLVNQQPVICAAQQENGPCAGVLFTLKPDSDPGRTLQRLLSIRDRSPALVLNESAPQVYVNVADFLNTAPLETDQSSNAEALTVPQASDSISTPGSTPIENGAW